LSASDGRERRLADFRGQVVALSVGYTQCPDVCPTTLLVLKGAVEALSAAQRQRVQVLFATLDPDRDALAMLKEYVAAFRPGGRTPGHRAARQHRGDGKTDQPTATGGRKAARGGRWLYP
jgi:cytochrome oxidase Cu insertion factor (SCO1/SenC/PrrC family)